MSHAIAASNISLTYPGTRREPARAALRGIDLTVPAGQALSLLGPNGSGKSTLMRIICGLLVADSGEIRVFGESSPAGRRRSLGVVFQTDSLDPHLTVRENLRDQATLYGLPANEARQRIDDMLEQAGLADRRGSVVKTLSRGLSRRVDLVRALLHRPPLLLLDEPTVGLDPTARETFLSLIEQRREQDNLTVLMSTHLMDEADRQERVVLLHQGCIVADDSPAALRCDLGAMLVTVHDSTWNPPNGSLHAWRRASGTWTLQLGGDMDEARTVASDLAAAGVAYSIAPPTLADVFEHFTGSPLNGLDRPFAEHAA